MFPFFTKSKKSTLTRIEIINSLIAKNGYRSYLEIGVNTPAQPGWSHDSIIIETKHGVDPNPEVHATFPVPSDDFFEKHIQQKYDIVFVDGLHIYEQAYRDIMNSLKWLNENGTIVVHDCNPVKEITQRRERASDVWHGDVWKAVLRLRLENPNIDLHTVDADEGCGIIRHGQQELFKVENPPSDMYTYSFLKKYRQEILQLLSPDEFKQRYL